MSPTRYKLVFFIPTSHLRGCKRAIFSTGAGRYPGPDGTLDSALYVEISADTAITANFTPSQKARPFIGNPGVPEVVQEVKCEIMCVGEDVVREAIRRLEQVHPYEVPVWEVYRMEDF